jgi:hypothetical protein
MALQKWEVFQDEATDFLNNYFKADFIMDGGFDATTSYITAKKENHVLTTIEAKFGPTLAGQIVLLSHSNKFSFSDKSKNTENAYTQEILKYLNDNYASFKGANTASIPIDISDSTLYNWVKEVYKEKSVQWIISSKKHNMLTQNDLLFIPVNEIANYFDISITFRRKKTGNTHIPGKDISDFKTQMDLISEDYQVKKTDNKYLLTATSRLCEFNIGNKYLLTMTNVDCQYFIKKKDINTNPNLMIQLKLKDNSEFKGDRFKEDYKL